MKPILSLTAALAASMLIAQPCFAAEDIRDRTNLQYRPSPYAGATLRLNFGGAGKVTSRVRLQAGMTRSQGGGATTGAVHGPPVAAFEVGASPNRKPAFYIGGQEVRDVEQRLGVRGSTGKTLLIVGGVLVVVVIVGLMTSGGSLGPCTEPGC